MKKLALASGTLVLISAPVSPAFGQAWIGQMVGDMMAQQAAAEARHRCYMGDPNTPEEVAEALAPTNSQMQDYFSAMQAGNGSAADFFALDKRALWKLGEVSYGEEELASAQDPFAVAGNALDAEPQTYVRSGQYAFTLADWQVRDGEGNLVGTYTGYFVRKLGDWKLRKLTLTPANEYVAPVLQFCEEPDDVLPYRLDYGARWQGSMEKSVAKAETKLAGHQEKLAKAQAKLAEKPESSSRKARVTKAQENVTKWETKLAERSERLAEVTADYEAAKADEAKAKADKEAAIAALAAMSVSQTQ